MDIRQRFQVQTAQAAFNRASLLAAIEDIIDQNAADAVAFQLVDVESLNRAFTGPHGRQIEHDPPADDAVGLKEGEIELECDTFSSLHIGAGHSVFMLA